VQSNNPITVTYNAGQWNVEHAKIITEHPVTLFVNNQYWLTFMCTPVELEALAAGFLYNEKIIQTSGDIASMRVCPSGDSVDVWLNRPVKKPDKWIRTSGCSGGETSIDEDILAHEPAYPKNMTRLPLRMIENLSTQLINSQVLYRRSGGVHTSALSDGEKIILTTEDIGRHNTLDKLAGKVLLGQIRSANWIILTTGRISSEMIQKAGRMGASIVISLTSPTSLSILLAEQLWITLIGYARRERFKIYTHPERILEYMSDNGISSEAI
jgi:FdhD protein